MRKKRRIMSGLLALCIALSVLPLSACTAPKLTLELKSTVGAGDSMVAGLACGFIGDNELEEAFRMGVACASARCTTEGYRVIDKNLYREFLSKVEIERL